MKYLLLIVNIDRDRLALITASSMDVSVGWAKNMPTRFGAVEVREVAHE